MIDLNLQFQRGPNSFHQQLLPPAEEWNALKQARKLIRQALRAGLPQIMKSQVGLQQPPEPKFHTQGSCAYNTLIVPAYMPPQQSDMDDGCYVPLSFMRGAAPSIASKFFFDAVEAVLTPLCRQNGWRLNPGKLKATCSRVEIDATKHIDLPLYAIPDQEFITLMEALHTQRADDVPLAFRRGDTWTSLPTDGVLLAHREHGWIPSDPRPIALWVERQVSIKTEVLRRIMRYLKAWRDWQWKEGTSPSSLLLMVAADTALAEAEDRDDMALLTVTSHLPDILRGTIINPVAPTEPPLSDKLDQAGIRLDVVRRANQLQVAMEQAMQHCTGAAEACLRLQQVLGPRFPSAPALNKTTAAAVVSVTPARKIQAQPTVGRTRAG
jgi:hypothetical protein